MNEGDLLLMADGVEVCLRPPFPLRLLNPALRFTSAENMIRYLYQVMPEWKSQISYSKHLNVCEYIMGELE